MGNSIGIECTYNNCYVTNIFFKNREKTELWNFFWEQNKRDESHGDVDTLNKQVENITHCVTTSCLNTCENANGCVINRGNEHIEHNKEIKKEEVVPFYTNEKDKEVFVSQNSYLEMQNMFFRYIATAYSLMDDTVSMHIIKEHIGGHFDKEFSLNKIYETCKTNARTGESELESFVHLLWEMHNNIEIEGTNGKENNKTNNNIEENLLFIYCWSFKKKNLEQLLIKSETFMKNVFINITGIKANYIKNKIKKLNKLKKCQNISNVCYHEEMRCTNISMSFLKKCYPNCFYQLVPTDENKKTNNHFVIDELSKRIMECVYLNKNNMENFDFMQIVNLKSIVTYYVINKKKEIIEIGNSTIGSTTIASLWILLTGEKKSFEDILELSKRGKNERFDMAVKDIYGSSYDSIGLNGDIIASLFGKAQNINSFKQCVSVSNGNISNSEEKDTSDSYNYCGSSSCNSSSSGNTYNTKESHLNTFSITEKYQRRRNLFNYYSDTCCAYIDEGTVENATYSSQESETKEKKKKE